MMTKMDKEEDKEEIPNIWSSLFLHTNACVWS